MLKKLNDTEYAQLKTLHKKVLNSKTGKIKNRKLYDSLFNNASMSQICGLK